MKNTFLIWILLLLIAFSCSKKDDDQLETEPVSSIDLKTVDISGSIELPAAMAGVGGLSVVSGFYEGTASFSANQGAGIYDITLNDENLQLVSLLNGDSPIAFTIAFPDDETSLTINAKSTATALVYLNPFLVNSDPKSYEVIQTFIHSSPHFAALEQKVAENMSPQGLNMGNLFDYIGDVIDDVYNDITEGLQNAGIGLDTLNVAKETVSFQLVNRRKRWLSVFTHRYKNGVKESTVMYENEIEHPFYELRSDRASYVFDFLFLEEISPKLEVPLNDSDSIVVSCYGLGKNPPLITSPEWDYGLDAVASTLYFDFTIELFSVYSGLGNQIAIDLRGRPKKLENIQKQLLQLFKTKLIQKQSELRTSLYEGNYSDFLSECGFIIYEIVIDSENAKLFYDLLKEFGIAKVLASQIIKKILPALQIAEIANSAVNVGLMFYAITSQEWQTNFLLTSHEKVEKSHSGSVILSSQTEVNLFGQECYTKIISSLSNGLGDLTIRTTNENDPIKDLSPLKTLKEIYGNVLIDGNDSLKIIDDFENLEVTYSSILISNNKLLKEIKGFNQLESSKWGFYIEQNPNLVNINGFEKLDELFNLSGLGESFRIAGNPSLENISGFNNLTSIYGSFAIKDNTQLQDLLFLQNLKEIAFQLSIVNNDKLQTLNGLENLEGFAVLDISNNNDLVDYCAFNSYFGFLFSETSVFGNAYNPTADDILSGNCQQ